MRMVLRPLLKREILLTRSLPNACMIMFTAQETGKNRCRPTLPFGVGSPPWRHFSGSAACKHQARFHEALPLQQSEHDDEIDQIPANPVDEGGLVGAAEVKDPA